MRIWRVSLKGTVETGDPDKHEGYTHHPSKRAAFKAACEAQATGYLTDVDSIEITPTKRGIIDALDMYAGHADNG